MQKATAAAKSALGTYESFALSTQDQSAKQMFQEMSSDMQRHVAQLNSRLNYLESNNGLNSNQG
jgi:rubrerythrin